MSITRLYKEHVVLVPKPPSRFTLDEWHLNSLHQHRVCLDQQKLSDSILAECDRVRECVNETVGINKANTDQKLQEKVEDIKFYKGEILKQRKDVCAEIDNLVICNDRITSVINSIDSNAMAICKKCVAFRENRTGIDLCRDDIERELLKEMDVIEGCRGLLTGTLQQASEQLRKLRATLYFMDRDLEDKENVLKIENWNLSLKEFSSNLSMYHGFTPLNNSDITFEEYEAFTHGNIVRAAKEITSGRQLRIYVDTLIRQVMSDLKDQKDVVDAAFQRRTHELKHAKLKLETQHSEVTRQISEMTRTIQKLQEQMADKEGYMALAHTRLGNRAQRPGMELCRDHAETSLVAEVTELRNNIKQVQLMLNEAQASLRYLLKTQIMLEQDINVKTNTLKIDEVECMALRQTLAYQNY